MHILSLVTDNNPFLNESVGREESDGRNGFMINLHKSMESRRYLSREDDVWKGYIAQFINIDNLAWHPSSSKANKTFMNICSIAKIVYFPKP